jgi:FixJ family two-component response regulator
VPRTCAHALADGATRAVTVRLRHGEAVRRARAPENQHRRDARAGRPARRHPLLPSLTDRENEVPLVVARRLSNADIAAALSAEQAGGASAHG